MTIIIILILIVLAFTICVALLLGKRDNHTLIEKQKLTDDVQMLFNNDIVAKDDSLKDNDII